MASITSCSSVAGPPTRGDPSDGTHSDCSPPTGSAVFRAGPIRATIPTATCPPPTWPPTSRPIGARSMLRCGHRPASPVSGRPLTDTWWRPTTDRGERGRWSSPPGPAPPPTSPIVADDLPTASSSFPRSPTATRPGLADGGVLVVGASASGLQIADELGRSGRDVVLAVGDHVRLPRTYRGMDIHWWMDAVGQLDERYDEVDDIDRRPPPSVAPARRLTRSARPRPQLASPERRDRRRTARRPP